MTLRRLLVSCLYLAAFAVLLGGCADPAAEAPDAAVATAPAGAPAAAPGTAASGVRYHFAPGSTIGFVGSKVTGSHDGGFGSFDGFVELIGGDPATSRVEVTIDTTTIWADNERLTGHLKSDDFFAVETFPTATFRSTAIQPTADSAYSVTGTLDLHGVTKEITFPATIEVGDDAIDVQAEFAINRFDFGIEYKGKADDLIRPEVLLRFDLQAAPATEAPVSDAEEAA